ncbi:hypothetical protein OAF56_04700 [Pirellulaceae bacterium]|nr:hypothetical protein [Pirellulaceae bacterium]
MLDLTLAVLFVPPTGGFAPPHQPPDDVGFPPQPANVKQASTETSNMIFRIEFPCKFGWWQCFVVSNQFTEE